MITTPSFLLHFTKRSDASHYEKCRAEIITAGQMNAFHTITWPHHRQCPTKTYKKTGDENFPEGRAPPPFPFPLLPAYQPRVNFSFIIHILPLAPTAGDWQILFYRAVQEVSYISASSQWMMTLDVRLDWAEVGKNVYHTVLCLVSLKKIAPTA